MTATTTDSGKIYVIGGRTVAGSLPTNEEYDPTTDAWTRRAPMPTARIQHGAAAIGSKVYVVGGSSDGTDVLATAEVYDASTDSWRTLPSLPTARRDVVVVAFGGLIWAIDGFDGTGAYLAADVFDPQAGTWRTTVSVGFDGSLGTIAGGDILLIEQNQVDWGPGAAAATNPYAATFAATSSAAFDFAPGSAVASIGDLAYLVGGSRNGLAVAECKTVDGTRIQSGGAVVAKASLGTARRNLAAAAGLNGKIYAFGGYAGGSQALDTVEVLTP